VHPSLSKADYDSRCESKTVLVIVDRVGSGRKEIFGLEKPPGKTAVKAEGCTTPNR
jgi:hypothetical protein